jgi:hypothetical protein
MTSIDYFIGSMYWSSVLSCNVSSILQTLMVSFWWESNTQSLEPTAYSWIGTTPLMIFLPASLQKKAIRFISSTYDSKKDKCRFLPCRVSNPWSLCRCVIIRSRRTKPLCHRATSARDQWHAKGLFKFQTPLFRKNPALN